MSYNEAARNIREKHVEHFVETHGTQLYHYTTIPALQNILSSKEFWLGSTASITISLR